MTFSDYRYHEQPALGKSELLKRIQRELRTRNFSLTGPRGTGKSCVVRALVSDAGTKQMFHGIVFCDLKRRGIDGDEAFYQALTYDIQQQLPDGLSKEWLDSSLESPIEDKINLTADEWEKAEHKVLFVLDGIDDAFLSLGSAWSFLCNFVERAPVTFLCTSRRRIRELCNTREKRDSMMSDRFRNPADIQPLDASDIDAIVQIEGAVANGVSSAVLTWSGGHPALAIALCEEASKLAGGTTLQPSHINAAAETLVRERAEELELIWQELDPDERELFITAGRTGEIPAQSDGVRRLRCLGLLVSEGNVLKPKCRLMQNFGINAAKGVALFREWFGTESAYLASLKQVLTLRLGPYREDETELVANIRDAIEAIERPDKAARAFRDIAVAALECVWDAETPTRQVPALRGGLPWLVRDRNWPEVNADRIGLLDALTDDRKWESPPKKVNRKHFVLIAHVLQAGDFKYHKNGEQMTSAFLAATVISAVELVVEMRAAGLV